ncbi:MAG: hypothetical protein HZB91_07010 [Elusimicrobia bacterium]|nr:hypothetical protein [Elusimicrobiota bacterium]
MTAQQATVEVFWTAFKALPRAAKWDILARLVADRQLRRELEDRMDGEAADRALREPGRIPWESLKKGAR